MVCRKGEQYTTEGTSRLLREANSPEVTFHRWNGQFGAKRLQFSDGGPPWNEETASSSAHQRCPVLRKGEAPLDLS